MRTITDPPGGDPRRKAEQLAFAQLLADYNDEQQMQQDLLDQGQIRPAGRYPSTATPGYPSITAQSANPELGPQMPGALEELLLNFTPAGDLEGIGTGLMEMLSSVGSIAATDRDSRLSAQERFGRGATLLGTSLAMAPLPGRIKPDKIIKKQVDPTASRVAVPTPGNPITETNTSIGSGFTITRKHPDDPGDIAYAETPSGTLIGSVHKSYGPPRADGDDVYEVLLGGGAARRAFYDGNPDELIAASRAAMSMLESVPVGSRVQSSSYSTNSLPMLLTYWRQGKLSAGDQVKVGVDHYPANSMGKYYKPSEPVTSWHSARGDYLNAEVMSKEEFFDIDPDTKALVEAGKMRQANQQYEYYVLGAENKWGVTTKRFNNREDAERVAATFAQRVNEGSLSRQRAIDTYTERGVKFAPDETPLTAEVVENYDGTFTIEYPLINFKRNFEDGGKYRVIKQ